MTFVELEECLRRIYELVPNEAFEEEPESSPWMCPDKPVCDLESEY